MHFKQLKNIVLKRLNSFIFNYENIRHSLKPRSFEFTMNELYYNFSENGIKLNYVSTATTTENIETKGLEFGKDICKT